VTLDAVVKLGGSLLEGDGLLGLLGALADLASSHGLLVVPGGGPFADAVRAACERQDPGESAAHWMAILAMDQFAQLLAGLEPRARLVGGPDDIATTLARGRLALLAPFAWFHAEDPLPHGWHVTSDSIAAWVAGRLGAARLVLLKSTEGVRASSGAIAAEAELASAARAGLVDAYFPHALAPHQECWLLSGRHPDRIGELLSRGQASGTRLR
jgi:aspartokinase-like uncharacterized kinase